MSRRPNPELLDQENPEWTQEDMAGASPFRNLSESLGKKLIGRQRGLQKAPTKERITIRFSRDVVERFRATGPGWQTRMDEALKEWLHNHSSQ